MIVELLRVQCGCGNQLTGLFDNHHAAIVAGERAGWLMQSESIGGDLCPRCLGREEVTFEEVTPVERLSAREAARRALPLTGSDAQALEGALAMTERERAEERAEVERLEMACANGRTALDALRRALAEAQKERDEARADRDGCIARGVKLWEYAADVTGWYDSALALVDLHEQWEAEAQKERDEARAEVERLKVELAAARKECLRVAREQWDTNDNGAIKDADDLARAMALAGHAEASDLRALAEREAVTDTLLSLASLLSLQGGEPAITCPHSASTRKSSASAPQPEQLLSLEQFEADEFARKYLDGEGGGDE